MLAQIVLEKWNCDDFVLCVVKTMAYFGKWSRSKEKCSLCSECIRILHKNNPIVFTILSAVKPADFISLAPFFAELDYLAMFFIHRWHILCVNWIINNIANKLSSVIIVPGRWKLVYLMAEKMMDIIVLVLWRYLECLLCRTHFSSEKGHFIEDKTFEVNLRYWWNVRRVTRPSW